MAVTLSELSDLMDIWAQGKQGSTGRDWFQVCLHVLAERAALRPGTRSSWEKMLSYLTINRSSSSRFPIENLWYGDSSIKHVFRPLLHQIRQESLPDSWKEELYEAIGVPNWDFKLQENQICLPYAAVGAFIVGKVKKNAFTQKPIYLTWENAYKKKIEFRTKEGMRIRELVDAEPFLEWLDHEKQKGGKKQ